MGCLSVYISAVSLWLHSQATWAMLAVISFMYIMAYSSVMTGAMDKRLTKHTLLHSRPVGLARTLHAAGLPTVWLGALGVESDSCVQRVRWAW